MLVIIITARIATAMAGAKLVTSSQASASCPLPCTQRVRPSESSHKATVCRRHPRVAVEAGVTDFWHQRQPRRRGHRHRQLWRTGRPASCSRSSSVSPAEAVVDAVAMPACRLRHRNTWIQTKRTGTLSMTIKVAINGFQPASVAAPRAIFEQGLQKRDRLVAINASGDLATQRAP